VIRELARRRVGRVSVAYVAVAYAVLEVARVALPWWGAPEWWFRAALGAAALGFPLATVLAWDFDITPTGIVRTADEEDPLHPPPAPRRPRLPWLLFVGFWVLLGLVVRLLTA
jgi:hypothetical protein